MGGIDEGRKICGGLVDCSETYQTMFADALVKLISNHREGQQFSKSLGTFMT